jgi:uncharacterized protein (DUF885 family)
MTRSINVLADDYLTQMVNLDPIFGTELGAGDDPAGLHDYPSNGISARADLDRATLKTAETIFPTAAETISKQLMIERLRTRIALHDAGEWMADINVIASPQHQIKQAIDLMPRTTNEDWETIAERLRRVPNALQSYKQSLRLSLENGHVVSQCQVLEAARLARKTGTPGGPSYFDELIASKNRGHPKMGDFLETACQEAASAYLDLATFFEQEYLPKTSTIDGVGHDC